MEIQKIEKTYGRSPQADALFDLMGKKSVHSIFLQGLLALRLRCSLLLCKGR